MTFYINALSFQSKFYTNIDKIIPFSKGLCKKDTKCLVHQVSWKDRLVPWLSRKDDLVLQVSSKDKSLIIK